MTTFSLIIVTYNSSDVILPCLDSLFHAEGIVLPFEVIVVDNASTDGTVEAVRRKFASVTVLENKNNIGFAAALNQGAAVAKGTFLLLLNPDTVLHEGFLHQLHECFKSSPNAAIVGCNLVDGNGNHLPSCWYDPSLKTVFYEMFLPHKMALELVTENPATDQRVDMVSGACMVIRREVFQQLNGFDTRFFMYYEDADFCLRARQAGYNVYYYPAVSAFHHVGKSTTDMVLFYQRVFKSKLLFLQKHRPTWYYVTAYLMVIVGMLIRIPAYVIVGAITFNTKLLRLAKCYTLTLRRTVLG